MSSDFIVNFRIFSCLSADPGYHSPSTVHFWLSCRHLLYLSLAVAIATLWTSTSGAKLQTSEFLNVKFNKAESLKVSPTYKQALHYLHALKMFEKAISMMLMLKCLAFVRWVTKHLRIAKFMLLFICQTLPMMAVSQCVHLCGGNCAFRFALH